MLEAINHGKVASSIVAEDLLTSTVVGMLSALPAEIGLGPWLRRALPHAASERLAVTDAQLDAATFKFWPSYPYFGSRVEPDVVIEMPGWTIIIEAKYRAGPSGEPGDGSSAEHQGQLGRQWASVRGVVPEGRLDLIYLTNQWSRPHDTLSSMAREVGSPDFNKHLWWLSWRHVEATLGQPRSAPELRAVERLRRFLQDLGMEFFGGVRAPANISRVPWSYKGVER